MHIPKAHYLKLINATVFELDNIRGLVDPFCINLYPSIMYLWYNEENLAEYIIGKEVLLGKLYPHKDTPKWTISSNKPITPTRLEEVSKCIRSIDQSIQNLSFVHEHTLDWASFSPHPKTLFNLESADDGDYIYDLEKQISCQGGLYEDMRRHSRKFQRQYGDQIEILVLDDVHNEKIKKEEILHLFDDWLGFGTDGAKDPSSERKAIDAFLDPDSSKFFGQIVIILLKFNDKLVGFSVSEINKKIYAVNHFHKANLNLSGISYYMFHLTAKTLFEKGVLELNFQEDAGIDGLRAFKEKMRPSKKEIMFSVKIA